jgi:hypothetical protein
VTRRRRGAEPPVPAAYGTPDVRWQPSHEHDAVHVAALNLQHLVLCEIRRQAGDASTTDLSRLLGVNPRTAQRIAAGDHLLGVDEIVELAALFGDSLLEVIPRTAIELFPETYRSYLGAWRAGTQELPVFAQPSVPGTILWAAPCADLSRWLGDELQVGRIGLVNEWVVAHHLAELLADTEIPSSLIMLTKPTGSPVGWLRLDVLTRIPTRLTLGYLLDPIEDPLVALRNTLSAFYEVLSHDGQRVALLCLGHRMIGQLRVHVPNLAVALPGDTVTVPFQVAGQLGASAARESGAADLALSVEAFAIGNPGVHVLVVSVGKTV